MATSVKRLPYAALVGVAVNVTALVSSAIPVPLTGNFWGEPEALSVTSMYPDRLAAEAGVNSTTIKHDWPVASVLPVQPFWAIGKAVAFVEETALIVTGFTPMLVTEKNCCGLPSPTGSVELKVSAAG